VVTGCTSPFGSSPFADEELLFSRLATGIAVLDESVDVCLCEPGVLCLDPGVGCLDPLGKGFRPTITALYSC